MSPAGDEDEKGAVIVMVAVFAVAMVAMAALVIDVGSILDEKRQLQNGADAAALGAAQFIGRTCPTGPCSASTLLSDAQGLANGNALDGVTKIDAVTPDYVTKRVTVTTSTQERDGRTILPYWFGQALTGTAGKKVSATAVASWAAQTGLSRAAVIPLTISKCEFDRVTSNNAVFDVATVILFHDNAPTCAGPGPSGSMPGGFGWVTDNDSNSTNCSVTPTAGGIVGNETGNSEPPSCHLSTLLNRDVLVAVFDDLSGQGNNGTYHIYGFAMFHLTGFKFPGDVSQPAPCGGGNGNSCIGGYFIRFVASGELGGPSLGNGNGTGNSVALLS